MPAPPRPTGLEPLFTGLGFSSGGSFTIRVRIYCFPTICSLRCCCRESRSTFFGAIFRLARISNHRPCLFLTRLRRIISLIPARIIAYHDLFICTAVPPFVHSCRPRTSDPLSSTAAFRNPKFGLGRPNWWRTAADPRIAASGGLGARGAA